MPFDLIATTVFGLEAVVARELEALGYQPTIEQNGRVAFQGDASAIARANLWLRSAERVLLRMGTFDARDFGVLFDGTRDLPWEQLLGSDAAFPVSGKSVKSQLSSVPACQKIAKKAIVERLREAHQVSALPETGPEYAIEIALLKDVVTLSIDTSGAGLHKRGYRKLVGAAPLKETLAAALVQLSFWHRDRPFLDPFCGSGTIAIEAALIAANRAPGMHRAFAAEAWPQIDTSVWSAARRHAADSVNHEGVHRLIATDIDDEALSLARYHAKQAGVDDLIHFQQRAFADMVAKKDFGCVITNPPYGERLGESAEVDALYAAMPEVFARLDTWSIYVLTAYPEFERLIEQQADRRRKLYNGRIACTYFQFHGPKPGEHHAIYSDSDQASAPQRAFGGLPESAHRQADDFANRLRKTARHLRRWPTKLGITCYRLYERDIPDVPLIVDRYGECLHIGEAERPNEHTAAEHSEWLDLMATTAAKALDIDPANVFVKQRRKQRGSAQHERVSDAHRTLTVDEANLRFEVNLSDYVDTGLFLDHRNTRAMVRDEASGKRVLNLFSYTGSFTVYAKAGGARTTTSVDLSATYLDWAKRNFAINFGTPDDKHRFIRSDVMAFLSDHPAIGEDGFPGYDLAVIDPPTFSNSKRTEDIWDVQRDHVDTLVLLIDLMARPGVIYFSTNFRRFKMDDAGIAAAHPDAVLREISKQTVPDDFRNRRVHRCWRIELP